MSQPVVVEGVQWWSTRYACAQLGVRPEQLRDWVRRSKQGNGFPQVDPPRRRGNTAAYRSDQLIEAEYHTATAQRGRRRAEV